jgi:hypothetical protein
MRDENVLTTDEQTGSIPGTDEAGEIVGFGGLGAKLN